MELANLYFGQRKSPLEQQIHQAREFGLDGLGVLEGGALPLGENQAGPSGGVRVWSLGVGEEGEDCRREWHNLSIPGILSQLKSLGCSQLLVPCGFDPRQEVRERGQKILDRVFHGEKVVAEDEALEEMRCMPAGLAEQQLERFAAFLYDLQQAAPGLTIAVRPEATAASLLTLDRMEQLLQALSKIPLRLWHDTGVHALRQDGGLDNPGAWLDRFAKYLSGSTLHDYAQGALYSPPGLGGVDWSLLGEYLPRTSCRVLAVAPSYSSEVLLEARTILEARLPT